jgi:hypothetical protein
MKDFTKKIMFATMLFCIFSSFLPQNTAAQNNLKRTVLFTLGKDEYICYGEYNFSQTNNPNKFACLIENAATNHKTFVFNGKRIMTETETIAFDDSFFNDFKADFNQYNGYIFTYRNIEGENTNHYVNNKGKIEGPFDGVCIGLNVTTNETDVEYLYKLANRWYVHKNNGQNKRVEIERVEIERIEIMKIEAPYDVSNSQYHAIINGAGYMYVFEYTDEKNKLIYINDYDNTNTIEFYSYDKKHTFYSTFEKEGVIIDGKIYGHSPAYYAYYDKNKNTFVWNAIENSELVIYEYKLE